MKLSNYLVLVYRLTVVFLLFTICRFLFYVFNTNLYTHIDYGHLLMLMFAGLRFDLTAILYTNVLVILASTIPFRFRYLPSYQKVLQYVFFVFNGFAILLNLIDIIYFRFTLRRTSWTVVSEFANDVTNSALMLQFLSDFWYIVVLWLLLIGLMVYLYRRVEVVQIDTAKVFKPWLYYPSQIVLMAACVGLFIGGVRGGFDYSTRPITISNAAAYVDKPIEIGIVLNTPFSIFRTLERSGLARLSYFNESDLQAIYSPIHNITPPDTAFNKKNVVIFIVESLSKEYIGVYNQELENGTYQGYTPFLDSLIGQSYSFDRSFSNGAKSIDAMPSILASIPSFVDPYVLSIYSNNTINSLASLLAIEGYDCSFFHGAPNGSMGFDAFARMAGFQHYYGKTEFADDSQFDGRWGIWDEPFFQYFASTLNTKKEPFLGALFSVTSHHPFVVPPKYENVFPKGTEEIHQCIGYTDRALKEFFETARTMPWFNNTIFVITADHTNQTSYEKSKTALGYRAIPIIIYDPSGDLVGRETEKVAQQIDIMPTILNYLAYPKPYFAFGYDALGKDSLSFGINYNGFYQIVHKNYLLQQSPEEGVIALYDYVQDPLLSNKLNQKTTETQLNNMGKAFIQEYQNRLIDNDLVISDRK